MKKTKELKKTVCVTIEQKQERDLKRLAQYMKLNVSEVMRELLLSTEEIEAFCTLQDYEDKSKRKDVLSIIARTRRLFMEVLMSGHPTYPIGLQVAAVSYFDKSGAKTSKLFTRFVKALQRTKGYRFANLKNKVNDYKFKILISPKESREDVEQLISKYMLKAPDRETLNAIRLAGRKKKNKTQLKTKKK